MINCIPHKAKDLNTHFFLDDFSDTMTGCLLTTYVYCYLRYQIAYFVIYQWPEVKRSDKFVRVGKSSCVSRFRKYSNKNDTLHWGQNHSLSAKHLPLAMLEFSRFDVCVAIPMPSQWRSVFIRNCTNLHFEIIRIFLLKSYDIECDICNIFFTRGLHQHTFRLLFDKGLIRTNTVT